MESKESNHYWHEDTIRPAIVEWQQTGSEDVYTKVLHKPFCQLCAMLYYVDSIDREDATQECVLHLFSKLKYFDSKRPIKTLTWMTTLAKRFFINRHRDKIAKLSRQELAPDCEVQKTITGGYEQIILPPDLEAVTDRRQDFIEFLRAAEVAPKFQAVLAVIISQLERADCQTMKAISSKTKFSNETVRQFVRRLVGKYQDKKA